MEQSGRKIKRRANYFHYVTVVIKASKNASPHIYITAIFYYIDTVRIYTKLEDSIFTMSFVLVHTEPLHYSKNRQ